MYVTIVTSKSHHHTQSLNHIDLGIICDKTYNHVSKLCSNHCYNALYDLSLHALSNTEELVLKPAIRGTAFAKEM